MNWLAHFLLSDPTPAFRIGNLLPDLASVRQLAALPEEFQQGIRRHREIDAFTDAHPVVRQSIARLGPSMRRFGGIIIDLAYDHFLARHWQRYSLVPLSEFAEEIYTALTDHWEIIPEDQKPRVAQMIVDNWLLAYRDFPSVGEAITRIGYHFRTPVDLSPACAILQQTTDLFEADFHTFFPDLVSTVCPGFAYPISRTARPGQSPLIFTA